MSILIVGDGGIGSNLSLPLIKFLKFRREKNNDNSPLIIKIIDGDIVELHNPTRQWFLPSDKGKFKATVTADYLGDICNTLQTKNISIESHPYYLKENNIDLIEDGDIVLCGVDNYITRKIIEDQSQKVENILVIFGGNEYDDGDVNVLHKVEGQFKTPLLTEKHPEINRPDKFPDEIGCEEGARADPQLILANFTVAQYMLEALYIYYEKGKLWHEKVFDLKTGNVRVDHGMS